MCFTMRELVEFLDGPVKLVSQGTGCLTGIQ